MIQGAGRLDRAILWAPPLLLVAAGVLAYHETLSVPFLLDDHRWIVDNPTIRSLSSFGDLGAILGDNRRPVLQLSFALNFAFGGLEPSGYHAVNIAIHLLAGLTLFGIVRRTLEALESSSTGGARFSATGTALAVALLWLVHPLQTQAVSYIVQRGESLASLFYLLTLYCGIRGADVSTPLPRRAWVAGGIAFCALGMGTKAIMVTAPIVVLLHDRIFLSGSLREALGRRPWWYVGLFASWGVLAVVLRDTSGALGEAAPSPFAYALTQPGVLLHYLTLVLWPHPLCFDYGWPVADTAAAIQYLPAAVAIGSLVALAGWGLWRGTAWGFLAASCWLLLAPTSTVLPLADPAFEHRMYLALAPLLILLVAATQRGWALLEPRVGASFRAPLVLLIALALALGIATQRRNHVYQSPITLWQSVVAVAPKNARAHHNLGLLLMGDGRSDEAEPHVREAQRLAPQWADALATLGYLLAERGQLDRARQLYARSVSADPDVASARFAYGTLLARSGSYREAATQFHAAATLAPERGDVPLLLGLSLMRLGNETKALEAIAAARRLGVESAEGEMARSAILLESGRAEQGLSVLREALEREPDSVALANNLAWHLATHPNHRLRDPSEAVRLARRAAAGSRRNPIVLDTLAAALAAANRTDEARAVNDEALAALGGGVGDSGGSLSEDLVDRLVQRRAALGNGASGSGSEP